MKLKLVAKMKELGTRTARTVTSARVTELSGKLLTGTPLRV
ncbi:Uncharacterised protein [Mycobacterium tuberculosis]|nr:Uncharacterised protein [Mycobacterium tuberculosis]CKX65958.1 Uncharacterised protein [Mycobacterium tuberculosis]CNW52394.1 Uncharacterised protein [Mycobacterium tuberculosis]COV24098.1 Uncharacterised protein [Mycobacterium tuberculosis]COW14153.1 Uncharacterised protein [Mycobacterium tuberculosis]